MVTLIWVLVVQYCIEVVVLQTETPISGTQALSLTLRMKVSGS